MANSGFQSGKEFVAPWVAKLHPVVASEIVSMEPEVLKAIQELNRESKKATRRAISRRTHLPAAVVDYLCIRLRNDDHVSGNHLLANHQGYKITPEGERLLEYLALSQERKGR